MDITALLPLLADYQNFIITGALSVWGFKFYNEQKRTRKAVEVINHNSTIMKNALIRKGFIDPEDLKEMPV